jgi:hypothetical protein
MLLLSQKSRNFSPVNWVLVVSDYGVGDPKAENNVLDETHCVLRANFGQGLCLNLLSEFIDRNQQVVQAPECFLEGS